MLLIVTIDASISSWSLQKHAKTTCYWAIWGVWISEDLRSFKSVKFVCFDWTQQKTLGHGVYSQCGDIQKRYPNLIPLLLGASVAIQNQKTSRNATSTTSGWKHFQQNPTRQPQWVNSCHDCWRGMEISFSMFFHKKIDISFELSQKTPNKPKFFCSLCLEDCSRPRDTAHTTRADQHLSPTKKKWANSSSVVTGWALNSSFSIKLLALESLFRICVSHFSTFESGDKTTKRELVDNPSGSDLADI